MSMTTRPSLPIAGPPPRVRRDAAANSDRILCTAREVISADGVDALTMDRLATAAGVGKGTIFRAFGNRAGLFAALTDEAERDLQQQFLAGPPPLGPGAPPLQRLLAYGEARVRLHAIHGALLLAGSREPRDRFTVPARAVSATHVRTLLRQCRVPGDLDVLVEALLAPLDAETAHHLLRVRGRSEQQLIDDWQALARRIVGSAC